jgi:hypothetical protein
VSDFHWPERTVVLRIPGHARDLFHQFHAGFVTLAENGVVAIQYVRVPPG